MARLALVDGSEATAVLVRASSRTHQVVECSLEGIDRDADLVILEVPHETASLPTDVIETLALDTPVLLLLDRGATVPDWVAKNGRVGLLFRPLKLLDLRVQVRELLRGRPVATTVGPPTVPLALATPAWLSAPMLTTRTAAATERLGRARGAIWIVGEAGTGTEDVAAQLCHARAPHLAPSVWAENSSGNALFEEQPPGRPLWVPALDSRPLSDQRLLEAFLASNPERTVYVTSGDDPDSAVADGLLLGSLHLRLSRASVRLEPLRERLAELPALAQHFGEGAAQDVFAAKDFSISQDALRALAAYPWPENIAELRSVITRSVMALMPSASDTIRLGQSDLRWSPELGPALTSEGAGAPTGTGTSGAAERRGVVVPLDSARTPPPALTSASPLAEQPSETIEQWPVSSPASFAGVEALLAAFAHDIRNPMSTIKTFAGLQAATANEGDGELARLTMEACGRVDGLLEFLQRYAELSPSGTADIDLVEVLADAAGPDSPLEIAARAPLYVHADAGLARFVADALVEECRERAGQETAIADIEADSLALSIPTGKAAIDRLGKWVEGQSLPWRLALARDAARRAGGDLDFEPQDGELRLRWRLPLAKEETHGQQAGRTDRRRRSRSS